MNRVIVFLVLALVCTNTFLSVPPVFAAKIFEDGFESGDFSAWTATNGSPSVVTTDPHHGTYHARYTSDGGAAVEQSYSYKDFTAQAIVYVRMYVRFITIPPSNADYIRFFDLEGTANQWVVLAELLNDGGSLKWSMWYHDGATHTNVKFSAVTIDTGKYYCLELYSKVDSAAGEATLYVDGVSTCSVTDKDTDEHGNMDQLFIGLYNSYNADANDIYCDCVVVDTSYIGPERVPAPVGGVWVPVDKLQLLAPWIALISLTIAGTASFVCMHVYVKHKKKQLN